MTALARVDDAFLPLYDERPDERPKKYKPMRRNRMGVPESINSSDEMMAFYDRKYAVSVLLVGRAVEERRGDGEGVGNILDVSALRAPMSMRIWFQPGLLAIAGILTLAIGVIVVAVSPGGALSSALIPFGLVLLAIAEAWLRQRDQADGHGR